MYEKVSIASLLDELGKLQMSHFIVVRRVGGLFHRRVLLVISNLHTHHGVHVEAYQLPGLDHCYADLMGDISTSDMKATDVFGNWKKKSIHHNMNMIPDSESFCQILLWCVI